MHGNQNPVKLHENFSKKIWAIFALLFLVFQPLSSLNLQAESLVLSEGISGDQNNNIQSQKSPEVLFSTLPELKPEYFFEEHSQEIPKQVSFPELVAADKTETAPAEAGIQTEQNNTAPVADVSDEITVPATPVLNNENFVFPVQEATNTSVSENLASSTLPAALETETVIETKEATTEQPYEHFDVSNQEIKSVLPDDLVNPILVGVKKLDPALALKLIIQNVNQNVNASTATDTITYFDAFPATDLEYTLTGKMLKENIILKDNSHPHSFVYQLNLSQYDYLQTSSSTIELYRKGRSKNPLFKLYTISAPVMIDKNASSSTSVAMTLDGEMLTLTPDAGWLSGATYPVYVDPTVEVNVLNVYSHPVEGEYWIIDFVTAGQSDLVVTPADLATLNDMQFTSLTCDGIEATSTVDSQGAVISAAWTCEGLGQARFYDKKTGHHHMVFTFGGSTADAYNGNNVWLGGVDNNWETNGNWSLGTTPALADDVVISATSGPINIKLNAATSINSLTIGSMVATSTLSFAYDAIAGSPLSISGDLLVSSLGQVTHEAASSSLSKINISVGGNATVSGVINVDGKGYAAAAGPGAGGSAPYVASGGSYAGLGGMGGNITLNDLDDPQAYYPAPVTASSVYGSLTDPTDLGSGGGDITVPLVFYTATGGAGGGAVKLSVVGTTTISGTISANGAGSYRDAFDSAVFHAGGSGGSVNISTGELSGNGIVAVNGGNGGDYASFILGQGPGGGGGGRISVNYTSDTSSLEYQTHGGGLENYYNINDGYHSYDKTKTLIGGSGTLYKKADSQTYGDLILNNHNGKRGAAAEILDGTYGQTPYINRYEVFRESRLGRTPLDASYIFDSLTVKNAAYLYMPSGVDTVTTTNLNLQNWGGIDVAPGKTFSYTNINWGSGLVVYTGGNLALLEQNQDLVVPTSTPGSQFPTTLVMGIPGESRIYHDVYIGGRVTTPRNDEARTASPDSALYKINWAMDNLHVDYQGIFDANGRGYPAYEGPGAAVSQSQGAAHGGTGGGNPSSVYGSSTAPTALGSGGGGYASSTVPDQYPYSSYRADSEGGGAIILSVSGTTTMNGLITANAPIAGGNCSQDGGGAGGSIYLTTNRLWGRGYLRAEGGDSYACPGSGGTGGGGRIAVSALSWDDAVTYNVEPGSTNWSFAGTGTPGSVVPTYFPSSVDTASATSISNTSAVGNGDLTSIGLQHVIHHGFVWSTSTLPILGAISSLAVGGTATSSPEIQSGAVSAQDMLDGLGYWQTTTAALPTFFEYDFPVATTVNALYITGNNIHQFDFQAWDGAAWISLGGVNFTYGDCTNTCAMDKFYQFHNTQAYTKYKLVFSVFTPNGSPVKPMITNLWFLNTHYKYVDWAYNLTPTYSAGVNTFTGVTIATGGTSTASSVFPGFPADNAFDGNKVYELEGPIPTRWKSASNDLAKGGSATTTDPSGEASNPGYAFDKSANAYVWDNSFISSIAPTALNPIDLEYDYATTTQTVGVYGIIPSFTQVDPYPFQYPTEWTFDGWNGASWEVLDTQSTTTWPNLFNGFDTTPLPVYFTVATPSSYSKYRLHITGANSGDVVAIQEVVFLPASFSFGEWLEYELPEAKVVNAYSIYADDWSYVNTPRAWQFQAFDEGSSTWVTLDTATSTDNWSGSPLIRNFANTESYLRYRLLISDTNSFFRDVVITEFEIYEPAINDFDEWIEYQLMDSGWNPTSQIITRYNLASYGTGAPRDWTFEGWNGTSWDILQTVSGQTDWASSTDPYNPVDKTFFVNNSTAYNLYRFHFTHNNGGSSIIVDPNFASPTHLYEGSQGLDFLNLARANATGTFSALMTGLSPSTTYHYRAYAVDSSDHYFYGPDEMFTTLGGGNTPPNPPDTLAPVNYVNGSWVNDNTPTLTFNLTDPDLADTVKYEIQLSATSSFSSLLLDYTSALGPQGAFSFTLGQATGTGSYSTGFAGQTLPDSANYYWRAMTFDNSDATSTYSVANSGSIAFRLDTAPPVPGALSFSNVSTTTITTDISGSSDSLSGLAATPYIFYNTTASTNSGATSSLAWMSSGLTGATMYSFVAAVSDVAGNTATTVPASTTTPGSVTPPSGGGGGSAPPSVWLANYYCMVLNNDEPQTTSRFVTLNFSTDATVTKVVVSNSFDFSNPREFTDYTGNIENWDLCSGGDCPAGDYTVYAKFYSSTSTGEQVSGTLSDDIEYVVVDTTKPPVVNFKTSSSTALKTDDTAAVEVDLSYATTVPVTVNYVISGGASGSGTVTFPANTQSTNIIVSNIADPDLSKPKTIDVVLSNPTNSVLGVPEVHGIYIYGSGIEIPPAPTTTLGVVLQVSLDGQNWVSSLTNVATGAPVSLRASVSGTAKGEIFYQFFCEADGTISRQAANVLDKMVVPGLCAYMSDGVHVPQVVVLRDGKVASAAAEVVVGSGTPPIDPAFCELHPTDISCEFCTLNPTDQKCVCKLNPTDPECAAVDPGYCDLHPEASECVCLLHPTDPSCDLCAKNPKNPVCDFCLKNPQDASCDFCKLNPTDSSCLTVEPPYCDLHPTERMCVCALNPSNPACGQDPAFCELHPDDAACKKPFCVEHPADPTCTSCASHPTTPGCLCAFVPTDPSCIDNPDFCQLFPSDSSCCSLHPAAPECAIDKPRATTSTTTIISVVKSWELVLPARALTASFAFVGAPVITAAQYAMLTPGVINLTEILLILLQLFQSLLAFLGIRKKRNHWGTVYDAATKQPLDPAIVELIDEKTGKVVEQSITDMTGRYGFLVREGNFKIRTTKTHFLFPSEHVLGQEDEVFDQLYHGENLVINKTNSTVVAPNIPMDPLGFDWNQMDKQRVVKFHPWREVAVRWFFNSLFYIGLVWTIFTVLVSPSLFNFVCLAFYLVTLVIQWFLPKERLWGRVYDDETNQLISWIFLEISSPELNVVMGRAKSGPDGRFFLKAEPGVYDLAVYHKNNEGVRELLGTGRVTVGKNRVLNSDVSINLS